MQKSKHSNQASYPLSDHYDGEHFYNLDKKKTKKSFKNVLKMLREKSLKNKWPEFVENKSEPELAGDLSLDQTYVTYINHASHLIQLQNLNILLDPIYSKRAGPLSLLGPKRVRNPGIPLKKLPQIHVVLVSHNHYDHMDLSTLKKLEKLFQPLFIVPLGNRKYLKNKVSHILELDWWDCHPINPHQSVTLVPAQHWSMRKFGDANTALWGGFWIQSGEIKIYFSGDTGYGPVFKLINEKLGEPNISILPIGAYEPRWFMKEQHMNPEEAVLASLDLKSHFSIATHHQTFRLSAEEMDEPVEDLKKSLISRGIEEGRFLAPENGETIIFHKKENTILIKKQDYK